MGGSSETDGRTCWARGEPHSLCGDTSANDSGRIAIIAVFCAVGDIFFSAGSGKLAILASQLHAQVISPCNCVAKTASSPQKWGNNNIAGVDLG